MSEIICPICQAVVPHYKEGIYQCSIDYDTHFYQFSSDNSSEWIREFTVGFDIFYRKDTNIYSVNIGNSPWFNIDGSTTTLMDIYNKIFKMRTYL